MRKTKRMDRARWLAETHFDPTPQAEVLDRVLSAVRGHTGRPMIVFDLDGTLYDNRARTVAILRAVLPQLEAAPAVAEGLGRLDAAMTFYSIRDVFKVAGLDVDDRVISRAMRVVERHWRAAFFASEHLDHDVLLPGAGEFVRAVAAAGAEVVYLTGRDQDAMRAGTERVLRRDALPLDERSTLHCKPSPSMPDHTFKRDFVASMPGRARVVASFENEPLNLPSFREYMPDAMHVFVHTTFSDRDAPVQRGLYRITSFEVRATES